MYTNNFDGTDPENYMAGGSATRFPRRRTSGRARTSSATATPDYDKLIKQAVEDRRSRRARRNRQEDERHADAELSRSSRWSTAATSRPRQHARRRQDERLGQRALERRGLVPREVIRHAPGAAPDPGAGAAAPARTPARGRAMFTLHPAAAALRHPDAAGHQFHHLRAARPCARTIRPATCR